MNSFAYHIPDRSTAAIKAVHGMKNLSRLSTTTAMAQFKSVLTPIVTYGIEIMWKKLTVKTLRGLRKSKRAL